MLTRDEIIWGYRYLLGREPEDAAVVETHSRLVADVPSFRAALLRSDEFARIFVQFQRTCWVAAPVFAGRRLLWINLADRYVSLGCLQDSYEPVESHFLAAVLKPGHVFLDVGANVGWYSLLASTLVGDSGHIHAFEPRNDIAERLAATVALNALSGMITVHPIGLSNVSAAETLIWQKGSDNGGVASFGRGESSSDFVQQDIVVKRLDDLGIDKVDVIKIDIEGAEMLAIQGALATIERNRPVILSEVLPSQLRRVSQTAAQDYFDLFLARGYRAFIVDAERCGEEVKGFPPGWHKELANIAFLPPGRPPESAMFKTR